MVTVVEDIRLKGMESLSRLKDWDGSEMDHRRYGAFEIMASSGDVKKMWDRHLPEEVEDARRTFTALVGDKKYAAFKTDRKTGEKAGAMKEFDPAAEAYILVPPTQGG
jgi:hypothetical protein